MPDRTRPKDTAHIKHALALFVAEIEHAIEQGNFTKAEQLIEDNAAAAWFGLPPTRTYKIVQLLSSKHPTPGSIVSAASKLLDSSTRNHLDSPGYLAYIDTTNDQQLFMLAIMRMSELRIRGCVGEAFEQAENALQYLQKTRSMIDVEDGWALQTLVQVGVSAMLVGDFRRALAAFTQAQLHKPLPKFAFLTRDALIKSALLHASFGNTTSAVALLNRATHVPRTSSWVEVQLDAHRDFARILTRLEEPDEALAQLEAIDLHDIGEMWPFYIVALHRVLEAGGYHDELEHRLEMLDTMPFPRIDGDGFSGSIIPVKRAMLAMRAHRTSDAQTLLDRADAQVHYTRLVQAAADVYSGRPQQAIHTTEQLRPAMRGFRLLELRRLAVLAAAQFQSGDQPGVINTLHQAAKAPQGISFFEAKFFSPEVRQLGIEHIKTWPQNTEESSIFLTGLPQVGHSLTERELQIVDQLAKGHTRAQIADNLFVSVNTVKTQLRSLYRKLGVSSAADAVLSAQRHGLV